jgi:hypothetical protein
VQVPEVKAVHSLSAVVFFQPPLTCDNQPKELVITTNFRVNVMAAWLEENVGKYSAEGSIRAGGLYRVFVYLCVHSTRSHNMCMHVDVMCVGAYVCVCIYVCMCVCVCMM